MAEIHVNIFHSDFKLDLNTGCSPQEVNRKKEKKIKKKDFKKFTLTPQIKSFTEKSILSLSFPKYSF